MKEYKVGYTFFQESERVLNELAKDGWKHVTMTIINRSDNYVYVYYVVERTIKG